MITEWRNFTGTTLGWLRSKHWTAVVVRLFVLILITWQVFQWSSYRAFGDAPLVDAWPNTDFSRATVDLDEIESGGPPRDGIPAIDRPHFVSTGKAARWLNQDEPVIVLEIGRDARAYPLQILIWHEIVNDTVAGLPVAITFCPLCNASVVFERQLDAKMLDFGVTGRLRRSDMIMYDRQTESWWQQFTGEGIVGEYAGRQLKEFPSRIVAFQHFREQHPEGKVLSRRTGYARAYGKNPYHGYDSLKQGPLLLPGEVDDRLPPMERVIAVRTEYAMRLYPFSRLREKRVVNDQVGNEPIVVFSRPGTLSVLDAGAIRESRRVLSATAYSRRTEAGVLTFEQIDGRFIDRETGTSWNLMGKAINGPLAGVQLVPMPGGVHFAFAWLAFRPETSIFP
ncbi:MAG: DUF3179 domain-containing protein [Gammaproteobacteria bacterium]